MVTKPKSLYNLHGQLSGRQPAFKICANCLSPGKLHGYVSGKILPLHPCPSPVPIYMILSRMQETMFLLQIIRDLEYEYTLE